MATTGPTPPGLLFWFIQQSPPTLVGDYRRLSVQESSPEHPGMANNSDSPLFNDPSKNNYSVVVSRDDTEQRTVTLFINVPVRQVDIQFLTSTDPWIGLIKFRPRSKNKQ
jgi:hypothetical protein